ncbi:hypothetical protein LTS07_009931 [Exophiala sideris]|uniref:DUF4484 domain-containing protein n=1 Tax=Exophiala sideris TaxID=1016849 RepID=A0ABR0IY56_9EURO|nr:hypothetical protein LTS07_009931 [Exophiala sideris]KAK5028013.1 hypothetical protein LTR13_009242 [Exophiala sideris]KAK5051755.1 hypothetical protein LTR69_010046 [Exophiala sideris]
MAVPNPLRSDTSSEPPIPQIGALFIVKFDHRKGYTLGWHRATEDVTLEGVVEFKSLPSGLHSIEEDLIYFIHDQYAGLSAFINKPDEQSDRSARMLAVGVIVPLEHGRIGRSWRHAVALKELARALIEDGDNTTAMEEYWDKHKLSPESRSDSSPQASHQTDGYRNSRSMSAATTFISGHHALIPHHPASTLEESVKIFGPLIFPLYRAALLRKRILIVTETPVEFSCNLVPEGEVPPAWLRPLFTVGVLDIPQLGRSKTPATSSSNGSWIACTTDDVLSTKPDLYDILVLMPRSESKMELNRAFPKIVPSRPELTKAFPKTGIKSTQRDYDRFVHLFQALQGFLPSHVANNDFSADGGNDASSIASESSGFSENKVVVEPPSWSRAAYTSLVWWASAGDRRAGLGDSEEDDKERDLALLNYEGDDEQTREVALIAYFHSMTKALFQTIAEAVARADGRSLQEDAYHDDDADDANPANPHPDGQSPAVEGDETENLLGNDSKQGDVEVTQDDMTAMGLDSWSASDNKFVEDFVHLWWGRKAVVHAGAIECCGIRII